MARQPTITNPAPKPADDWSHLNDIEASPLAIEGLLEAVCELSANADAKNRKLSAICAVSFYLIDEIRRAKDALQKIFEVRWE